MPRQKLKQVTRIYMFAPIILAGMFVVVFPPHLRLVGVVLGLLGGFILPGIYTKFLVEKNRRLFEDQLLDALMIMSSSFRGGLSLMQAMEAVAEEMPDPINQEFSTVLGENKMGVSMDESLNHLYTRMPSTALQQMITSILLARETGGNLPVIFQRIVGTIRETKKIKSQIDTLTIQGKIQGVVMAILPLMFFCVIYSTNPGPFNHMLQSKTGRILLVYAAISEVVGAYMVWKISASNDF